MNLRTVIRLSIKEILSNKLRSFLTMLGVIIGVFSMITLIGLGKGATASVSDDLAKSLDVISVNVFSEEAKDQIKYNNLDDIFEGIDGITVSPVASGYSKARYEREIKSVEVKGVDESYQSLVSEKLTYGRFLNYLDVENRQNVVIINEKAKTYFFKEENSLGKTIIIDGVRYQVVGIMEDKPESRYQKTVEQVVMPISSMQRMFKKAGLDEILVKVADQEQVETVADLVRLKLDTLLNNKQGKYNDYYYMFTAKEELEQLKKVTGIFTLLLGGIASVSLLVGGVGIMNIMFVSVTERTREIGIRKAIGAPTKSIMMQFLIESSVVSCIGGIIGIALGVLVNVLVAKFTPLGLGITPGTILLPFLFSVAVGVIFGIYPASRASKLNVVDALRYE